MKEKLGAAELLGADFLAELDKIQTEQPNELPGLKPPPSNPVTVRGGVISAQDWATKQNKRAMAAGDDWMKGVLNPRTDPILAAIASVKKWIDRIQQAIKDDKFVKGLQQVNKDQMYAVIEKLGSGVYTAGVDARAAKYQDKITKLQPMVDALSKKIQAMPNGTDAERVQRLLAGRAGMLEIGKRMRGIVGG